MDFNNRTISRPSSSSDRLKKAIERNRAKVAKRSNQTSMFTASTSNRATQSSPRVGANEQSLSDRLARLKEKRAQIQGTRTSPSMASNSQASTTRNNPTVASKIEILKARRQSLGAKNVSATTIQKEASTGISEKIAEKNFSFFNRIFSTAIQALLAKTLRGVIWLANIFFLGVAIFGERGVVDYVKRHSLLEEKQKQLEYLDQENEDIKFQIYRLQNDKTYQRQIIRDYLGYIAHDEYLIIFAENQKANL